MAYSKTFSHSAHATTSSLMSFCFDPAPVPSGEAQKTASKFPLSGSIDFGAGEAQKSASKFPLSGSIDFGERQACSLRSLQQLKPSLLSDATSKKGKRKGLQDVEEEGQRWMGGTIGLSLAPIHGQIESHSVTRSMNHQFRESPAASRNLVTPILCLESFIV
ncbi:hypothetical protein B296_00049050 [Ensete ventricosum]|uniref:Uncharacterized protein n=1 Tax=Ensete ventricosum TaxID=4639 RepID=A0A426YJZ6_ENSVE|nr:hypothetical protein B296_00049050 [Ensete ventricosum]